MKSIRMRSVSLCAVLGILDACTTSGLASSAAPSAGTVLAQTPSQQMRASDRMFYWQEEALELHAMATHRAREAELVLKNAPGPAMNEFVKRMRLLAHQLQEAAEYADAQAKEAEREILPAMIQQLHSALDTSVKADIKERDASPPVGGASHGHSADQ
jgi:molecular chaperone DnaK (HSP70)